MYTKRLMKNSKIGLLETTAMNLNWGHSSITVSLHFSAARWVQGLNTFLSKDYDFLLSGYA